MNEVRRLTHQLNGLLVLLFIHLQTALADLPTVITPSISAEDDWLETLKGYMKDGAVALGLVLSTIAFIWIAWTALAKFNEARRGRGDTEWGELGMLGIVGAALLLFITYLLTESADVITAAGA